MLYFSPAAERGERLAMSRTLKALVAPGLVAAGLFAFAGSASAAPVVNPQALKSATESSTPNVETVRWYGRRGWGGRGYGWGYGGFAAGAIVGGALASRYYYPGPYY